MKKALLVTTVPNTITSFNLHNVKILQELGYEVHTASCDQDSNLPEVNHLLVEAGCVCHSIDFSRSIRNFSHLLKAYGQISRLLQEEQFEIIHVQTPIAAAITRFAFHGTGKMIYTAHGFHFYRGAPAVNWIVFYPIERLLAHKTDILITINKEDYLRAKKFKAGRKVLLPGVGIDTQKFQYRKETRTQLREKLGIPQGDIMLLSVGELNQNKNHQVIVRALAQLDSKVNWTYVICGDGPARKELTGLIQKWNLSDRIQLMGYRDDVENFYQAADLFLFPSFREGLPVSIMEAMASGLPVIASAIRGNVDLVQDRETGMLVSDNKPETYRDDILFLLEHPEVRKEYSEQAQNKIGLYSHEKIDSIMRGIYE